MQVVKVGRHQYVNLTINEDLLVNFLMLDLDAETATIICNYYGEGLRYKEIAQQLYKECLVQVTSGALNRIAGRLKRGREKIIAAKPSKTDLENYPEMARKAILKILARGKDPKNEQPEVSRGEETPSKDDNGPLLHPATPSSAHPNSCPRCGGNMLFEEDMHGAYSTCLSCGYVFEPNLGPEELRNLSRRRSPYHGKIKL